MSGFDIEAGGVVTHEDGTSVTIEPHSGRVGLAVMGNTVIETLLYEEVQEGEDPSDRIHLLITDFKGQKTGWIMNVEDVVLITHLLTKAAFIAIQEGIPVQPE